MAGQVDKVRKRFGIGRVALVGDRGMLTTGRLRENLEPVRLDWISALRSRDIHKLLKTAGPAATPLDPEVLIPDAVAEITSLDLPGERLLVCLNPRLREECWRKRENLLKATEETLAVIAAAAAHRKPEPANRDQTMKTIGREANQRKMDKAEVSESATAKADTRQNPDGLPVYSMTTLLADLGTLTLNEVTLPDNPDHTFPLMTKPTELQQRAFELLDIDPAKNATM